jgi:hypothetical protein
MRKLRPLTILVAGPLGVAIGAAVPFWFFAPESVIAAALFAAASSLPLFGCLAWAAVPTRCFRTSEQVIQRYRRFDRWFSVAGKVAGLYITGYLLLHLDRLLGPVGGWLLITAFFALLVVSFGKIMIHERLRRLHDFF